MKITDDGQFEILVTSRCPYCSTSVYLAKPLGSSDSAKRSVLIHPVLNADGNTCEAFNVASEQAIDDRTIAKKLITDVLRLAELDELQKFATMNLDKKDWN